MRIVAVNPYFFPYRGGIERRIHGVARELARRHEVFVLTSQLPNTSLEEKMDGFTIVRLPATQIPLSYNPPPIFTRGVAEAVGRLAPDIVDFHYRWAPDYTSAMSRVAQQYPLVFTYHNTFGEGVGWQRLPSLLNDALFLRFMERAKRVVCVSDFVHKDLARRGFDGAPMATIPNGVDPFTIPRSDAADRGKSDGFMLAVGRLVATKNLHSLLVAMSRAPSPQLVVVGDGPERIGLESQVKALGLGGRVRFEGQVPERRKNELLATAEFLVHPAIFESFGIAILEALAAGCPVLASNVGG
ncbi:MAG TPA: glycosyltransferase family 4 protein, partial [Burkholderiales bacterium]|nr:glycosyltransferase family 4 protein [Burkholderiales bacterium]